MPKSRLYVWGYVYVGSAVLVSSWLWTIGRDHLFITDGVPTATDPLIPLGVAIINVALVVIVWAALAVFHLLHALVVGAAALGRRGDRRGATRYPGLP